LSVAEKIKIEISAYLFYKFYAFLLLDGVGRPIHAITLNYRIIPSFEINSIFVAETRDAYIINWQTLL